MRINFNSYETATQKLLKRKFINKSDYKYISESKTKTQLTDRITDCYESITYKYVERSGLNDKNTLTPEEVSLVKILGQKIQMHLINFAKILSKKDTDPEVIKIKKQIKKEYNIKSLHLDNNLIFAKKIQRTLKILKDNNLNLPDEIIVNSILNSCEATSFTSKRCIILNPSISSKTNKLSTKHPLHVITHECIHINQPVNKNMEIISAKIPKEFQNTIYNLSEYSRGDLILEIHAELMTKKLLKPNEFTTDEQELLDYIETTIFKTVN